MTMIKKENAMEIERKYTVNEVPYSLNELTYHNIEQAYLCTEPVVRIRKQDHDYILTYKSKGSMVREEYNLPLTADSYIHLRNKADGNIITKKRYLIPYADNLTIELDVFEGKFKGLIIAEVEFGDVDQANQFLPPSWFKEDVTFSNKYHNSTLSRLI